MKFANFVSSLLDLAPRDASGNIVLQGATAEQRLNVEELAIFSTIDPIASAASLCEWRTYQAGERKKGEDWYSFNVEPNQNQNAAEFKRLLVARLLRFNEALVFERGGALYLADSFTRTEYAFRPCVYTGVTCNNLTLSYTLTEPDVFYFRLANQDAAALLANLRGLYSEAMKEALDKYKKSGGRSGILEISGQARGKKTFETDLDKLMNERFKTFFENKNAVLPLLDGFHYVPQDGAATQKGANEISDLDSLIKQAQDRACNVYHVAPSLLRGEVTNIDEAIRSTLSFGVKPPLRLIETEINRKAYGKDVLNGWKMMVDTTHIRLVDVFDAAAQADKRTGNVKLTYTPEQSQVAPIITSAFTSQRIVWGDSMLMRWYTNNACRLIDKRGNISFGKYEPKSRKTDGFMAMVAAFVAAAIKQDEMQAADYSSADLPDVYTY